MLAFSQQMLGAFPDVMEIRTARIDTFLSLKQDAKAKAETDALMARMPNSYFGRYYTALLMARANNKERAWEVMQGISSEFVKQNPGRSMTMAQLALDVGHVELAMTILINAISADPGLVDARLQLANLRLAQNAPQAALSTLAPIKDSSDPRIQKLLGNIRAKIARDRAF
jgi:predicted Zn-dependent protease